MFSPVNPDRKKKEMKMSEQIKTIDITPTWEGQMKMAIILLEDGTFAGKKNARDEIVKAGQLLSLIHI